MELIIEKVYTPENVCKILGLGLNSVYALLKSKELRSRRVGRKYLITGSAILEFLNN
ncbi:MAG: helix-turn-helix domain-containing protein [Clostridiaceae bacterium]|nr:helix-turn-helix domain-containing protein [Clostridiaceae bacterium]